MSVAVVARKRLVSKLVQDDPELTDIVSQFVAALPERLQSLQDAWREQAWDTLKTLAHQLKGSGGSYGYPELTAIGATMEEAFKAHSGDQFDSMMAELTSLVSAVQAGLRRA